MLQLLPFLTVQGRSRRPLELLIWAHSGGSGQGLGDRSLPEWLPNSATPGLMGMELSGRVMWGCGDKMLTIRMPGMAPNVTATSIQGLAGRQ